jgi:hypothetical protein
VKSIKYDDYGNVKQYGSLGMKQCGLSAYREKKKRKGALVLADSDKLALMFAVIPLILIRTKE